MESRLVKIIQPRTADEYEVYFYIRYETLRKPWNKFLDIEKNELSPTSFHFLAINEFNEGLGVCKLILLNEKEAQLRFMGVFSNKRKLGIGKKLIDEAEKVAKEFKIKKILLHAREEAVLFYDKCGYTNKGKSYLMWGEIQHYLMEKLLK